MFLVFEAYDPTRSDIWANHPFGDTSSQNITNERGISHQKKGSDVGLNSNESIIQYDVGYSFRTCRSSE